MRFIATNGRAFKVADPGAMVQSNGKKIQEPPYEP